MNRKKLLVIVLPVLFLAGAHGVLAKTMTMTSMASNESQCNSWIADKQKTGVTCYTSNGGSYTTTDITGSYNPYATGTNTCTITYECAGTIVVSGHGNENPAVNPINANYNTAASAKINPPVVTAAPAVPTVTLPWINTAADCTLQNNKSFGVCLAGKTGSPVLVKCAYGPACVCQVDSSKCGVIKMNPNASLLSVAPAPTAGLPTASMGVPVSNLNFTSGGKAVTATGFYKTAAGQYYFLSKSNLVYNPQSLTDIISHPEIYANDIAK